MTNPIVISSQIAFIMANGIMPAFTQASYITGVDRDLLLAVASRESNMGMNLDENWLGDNGHGYGIMQIDKRYHSAFTSNNAPNNHAANILKGATILKAEIDRFNGNKLHALAAYNAGPSSVREAIMQGLDPDLYTTGQNYGKDVLNRYKIIKALGGNSHKQEWVIKAFFGFSALVAVSGLTYIINKNQES